jgi:hypothetical protein
MERNKRMDLRKEINELRTKKLIDEMQLSCKRIAETAAIWRLTALRLSDSRENENRPVAA